MQSLFDPVTSEIMSLVGQQIKEAKAKKKATIDVLADPSRISIFGRNHTNPHLPISALFLSEDLLSRDISIMRYKTGAGGMAT